MGRTGRMDLFRGTLDMLVLLVLETGASHGYAIAKAIQASTDDVLAVEEGSLYPSLYRMEKRGWVAARWGQTDTNRRARLYELTPAGREQLAAERDNWAQFTRAVGKLVANRREA